eukprot:2797862-Amphidinium_carterae.1
MAGQAFDGHGMTATLLNESEYDMSHHMGVIAMCARTFCFTFHRLQDPSELAGNLGLGDGKSGKLPKRSLCNIARASRENLNAIQPPGTSSGARRSLMDGFRQSGNLKGKTYDCNNV